MPIPALDIAYVHRSNGVNTPRTSDAEVLIAEPAYASVAAKLVGVHNATALDVPQQNRGHGSTVRVSPS